MDAFFQANFSALANESTLLGNTPNHSIIARGSLNKALSTMAASLSLAGTLAILATFWMWPDLTDNQFAPNDRVYICWRFFSGWNKHCSPIGNQSRARHRLPASSSSRSDLRSTLFLLDSLFVVIFLFDYLQEDFIGMGKAGLGAIPRDSMGNSSDDCSDVPCVEGSWIFKQPVFIWLVLDLK